MSKITNTKNMAKSAAWIAVAIAIVFVLIAAMRFSKTTICKNIKVNILTNKEQMFLGEKNILELINANDIIGKKEIQYIDIKALEKQLENNIWIDNVEMFFTTSGTLNIDVQERIPLLRMFRLNGNSFYLDKQMYTLPLSNDFSAKVPVFTGFPNNNNFSLNDSINLQSIIKMANYLLKDSFWMAQIQQINIVNDDEFEFVPTVGNHIIQFGDTSNMENKFNKLFRFYNTVSKKVGFNQFGTINVKFKNEIITTKGNGTSIDTVKASLAIKEFLKMNSDSAMQMPDTTNINSEPIKNIKSEKVVKENLVPIIRHNEKPQNKNHIKIPKKQGLKNKTTTIKTVSKNKTQTKPKIKKNISHPQQKIVMKSSH